MSAMLSHIKFMCSHRVHVVMQSVINDHPIKTECMIQNLKSITLVFNKSKYSYLRIFFYLNQTVINCVTA